MNRFLTSALVVLALCVSSTAFQAGTALAGSHSWWFHVTVLEKGQEGESVRINLPASLVDASIPLLHDQVLSHNHVRIDDRDLNEADLRALLAATRDARDGEYVTIQGHDHRARVYKKHGDLVLESEDRPDHGGKVTVRMPMDVLGALLDGPPDQLNIAAAIEKLSNSGEGEFVSVESDSATVRIWIDDRNTTN